MANEFKITDIVSENAYKSLQKLQEEFETTAEAYAALVSTMASGVLVKPQTIKELTDKNESYKKVIKGLIDTQNQLSSTQKEYESLLKETEKQTAKNTKLILEESKAKKLDADAELALQKAETERLKQQKLLNQEKTKLKITTEEAVALTRKEVHSIDEAKEQNRQLRKAVSQVTDAEDKDNKIRQQLNNQIAKNTEYIRFNSDAYTRQKMAIGSYKNEIKAAIVELKNGNNTFKNLGIVAKGFGGLLKSEVASGLNEVRLGVGSMIKGMVGAQAVLSGVQKIISLFKDGIKSVIEFEAANSKLAAILGTTTKNMKDLIADAKRLGAATKYTASEATNLQIELAKLGFSRREILQSTEAILKFAQATGSELPEAAALAGASLRMFDASTRETERYVSAMAVATTKSALSFSYLQTAMPIVGPVAKAFNFAIEDTLALLGKLADAGFDASSAATATRNILLNLADSSGALAKALGGSVKTLPELVDGLSKLKDQGIDLNSTLELTDKRSVAAFNTFLTSADKIVPLRDQITGVTGELNDMAETMGDNVQGALAGLSSAWEAFMLSFYDSKGPMKDVIDFLAKGLREVSRQLKSYSQLQEDADNQAVANAQKEMATSDILEKHRERMARLYEEKVKEGMNADEAAIAAKEEYIETLKSQLDSENKEYVNAINKREEEEKKLSIKGRWYIPWWLRPVANKGVKESIETAKTAAAGKKAIASVTEAVIDDLERIDLKQEEVSGKIKVPSDKELKELEKAEKEKLRIREEYQQSEIDLMDEGLEKELSKISFSYNKRIAAIKGNSEDEIATRKNLSDKLQDELDRYEYTYNVDKEKQKISLRLEAVEKGSDEEYRLRMEYLALERELELNATALTLEEKLLVIDKYNKKRNDLEYKNAMDRVRKAQEDASVESVLLNAQMQDELDALAEKYTEGKIKKEEYEAEVAAITEKYSLKSAREAVRIAKMLAGMPGLSPEDKLKLERKAAEAEIALQGRIRDANVDAAERSEEAWKKKMEGVSKNLQMAGQVLNSFSELGSAMFDRRIEEIEKEQEANEEAGEKELDRITNLEETGAITKEEAEARKRAAEKRTADKDKELAKQKAELQARQARWDKANSVAQTIIATALAVVEALPDLVLAGLVGTMGAVSLATILAQPIPKYAKGTKDHPGGLAIVGDGGRHEAIVTDKGSYVTPSSPTLVSIPRHAMVIPDIVNSDTFRHIHSDMDVLTRQANQKGEPVTVNVNNDYTRLERKTDDLIAETRGMYKYMKKLANNSEWENISRRL